MTTKEHARRRDVELKNEHEESLSGYTRLERDIIENPMNYKVETVEKLCIRGDIRTDTFRKHLKAVGEYSEKLMSERPALTKSIHDEYFVRDAFNEGFKKAGPLTLFDPTPYETQGQDFDGEGDSEDVVRHRDICRELNETYAKKNADYGDSFAESLDKFGFVAAMVRMNDKMNRVESLSENGTRLVNDESMADTLLDLANYAIMTAMWLDKSWEEGYQNG